LLGGLINIAGTLAGRVLLSLGFAAVTYSGVSLLLGSLKTQAVSAFSALPVNTVNLLAFMKVGQVVSIITSALVVRATLNGLKAGGGISKLVKS
jgi:hypothetical protein